MAELANVMSNGRRPYWMFLTRYDPRWWSLGWMFRTIFVEIFIDLSWSLLYDFVCFHLLMCLLRGRRSLRRFGEVEFNIWVGSVRESMIPQIAGVCIAASPAGWRRLWWIRSAWSLRWEDTENTVGSQSHNISPAHKLHVKHVINDSATIIGQHCPYDCLAVRKL